MPADLEPGQWSVTTDPCECVCEVPLPTLQIFANVTIDGHSTGWQPFGDGGDAYFGPSINYSSTESISVQAQFRYLGGGGAFWKMQIRFLTITRDPFTGAETYLDLGSLIPLEDRDGIGVLAQLSGSGRGLDYVELPTPSANQTIYIIGGWGGPAFMLEAISFACTLRKAGFVAYRGPVGNVAKIFRQEITINGGYPGCAGDDIPAQTYSGGQEFVPKTSGVTGITDPTGKYEDTRSPDLKLSNYTSSPLGDIRIPKEFGIVVNAEDTKHMDRAYKCGDEDRLQFLHLGLIREYTTGELKAAVEQGQEDTGGTFLRVKSAGNGIITGDPVTVASRFLSDGETVCARQKSSLTFTCPGARVYLPSESSLPISVTCNRRKYNRTSTEFTETFLNFTLTLSVEENRFAPPEGRSAFTLDNIAFGEDADEGHYVEYTDFAADLQAYLNTPFAIAQIPPA